MALDTNLVAHYLLYDNADDETNTYDGIVGGGVVFSGEDTYFDGLDDYIYATNPISTEEYTISLWVKPVNSTPNNYEGILGKFETDGAGGFRIQGYSASGWVFQAETTGGTDLVADAFSLSNSEYTHIVAVRDSSGVKVYLDGVLNSSNDDTLTSLHSNTLWIGKGYNDTNRYYNGYVSNVRLYSDAKNQAFVDDLNDEGRYLKPESTGTITITGSAEAYTLPQSEGVITITGSAEVTQYVPESTGSIEVNGSAEVTQYSPESTGSIEVTGSASAQAIIAESSLFTFAYSIQQAQAESKFNFVYTIEQPKVPRIITRVNV